MRYVREKNRDKKPKIKMTNTPMAAAGVGVFGSGSSGNVGWAAIALGAEAVRAVEKQVEKPRVRCVLEDRWPAWLVHLRTGQNRTEQEKEIK